MGRIWLFSLCVGGLLCRGGAAWGEEGGRSAGSIQIQVIDPQGRIEPEAPVYVYGRGARGLRDLHSGDLIHVPSGDYDLVAALVTRSDEGFFTRHLSPLAHVHVTAGEQASVILPLAALNWP